MSLATLKKLKSDDGLIEMFPHVKIGTKYEVSLESLHEVTLYNTELKRYHKKYVILDVKAQDWLPSELLDIPGINN